MPMNIKLTHDNIDEILREVGPKFLKPEYKTKWTAGRPMTGYCYLVSEILFHYQLPDSRSYSVNLGRHGVHWFVAVGSDIYDLTAGQFDFPVPYGRARRRSFFKGKIQTPRGFMSERAWKLKNHIYGLIGRRIVPPNSRV